MIAGTLEHKGFRQGLTEGLELGRREGKRRVMQQVVQQEREEDAVRLIEVGMDTTTIAELIHLPQERIQELRGSNDTRRKG